MPDDDRQKETTMQKLKNGERVIVHTGSNSDSGQPIAMIEAPGVVVRTRHDGDGAWIRLDRRHDDARVHPFSADDEHGRGRDVYAWPEDCDPEDSR